MSAPHGKKPRIWGPKDDTWTNEKAQAHRSFSTRRKITPSWEEYRRLRDEAKEENARKALARMNEVRPVYKARGAKALRRPPHEIAATILEKVRRL